MRCLVLLLAIGCANATHDDDFPVEPNGAGPSLPPRGFTTLRGRICISDDLVEFRRCRSRDLAGFTVEVEDELAITDETGAFEVRAPSSTAATMF